MKLGVETTSQARDGASSKITLLKTNAYTTDTFNALSQIPKHIRQTIVKDGEILTNAPQWCEEIWKTMRKNDFATKGALNLPLIENIYKLHIKKFDKMLNIHNANELFEIMDADEDGSINEDEQILLFSVIKERMLKLSEDLCNIQEYPVYRDLMKAVRKLEQQIAKYQEVLRTKIYKSELHIYESIGEAKFDEFYEYYEKEFRDLNTYSLERSAQMRAQHEEQMDQLIDKLDRAVEAVKFKPKPQLREYQQQEKLVSIDERVEEAMNFRKELKDLEVSEAQRINKLRNAAAKKQINTLEYEQAKEMKHLESKLLNEENKLVIRMKRDYDILKKKTHLHENEITKIQGLAAKYAMQKAQEDGELQRMKNKSKKMNEIFVGSNSGSPGGNLTQLQGISFKKGTGFAGSSITMNSTDLTNRTNIDFVKGLVKSQNVIKFHLKKSYGEEPPVNVRPTNYANEDKLSHKKVEIYLKQKTDKKDEIPNLTSLYDDNLRPVVKNEFEKVEKLTNEDRMRTRQFINEKLNGDRKVAV